MHHYICEYYSLFKACLVDLIIVLESSQVLTPVLDKAVIHISWEYVIQVDCLDFVIVHSKVTFKFFFLFESLSIALLFWDYMVPHLGLEIVDGEDFPVTNKKGSIS